MPTYLPLDDPNDPRIAAYRDVREKDLVGREGRFIAEGETVLRVLAGQDRHRPLSVLIAAKRRDKLEPILSTLPDAVPVYLADQAVVDAVAGFPLHRGILALAERAPEPAADALLAGLQGRPALVMVLVGIANHDNMGGLFRNAAAFGADAVLLDPTCCDPLYRKAIRVSVGGVLRVPFARLEEGEDLVGLLDRRRLTSVALSPAGETPLHRLEPIPRAALLLGAEGPGLPEGLMARCRTVSIPMAAGFDSLNVAVTGGLALHHLRTAG
ncbi:TrmH family RNA methyltransferase [Caulobacter mirabilis]|uniref:RNA methyltransferase n=1 Tax=Caulobacter mirabilis TaxID=69666 RepID=A0A2D2B1T1_9CAUL|nr:RNA methyltransferase [Caulobacter mirabilis]ATQ44178.1 RNA methyltransferase [Caulobacter mirabilis]